MSKSKLFRLGCLGFILLGPGFVFAADVLINPKSSRALVDAQVKEGPIDIGSRRELFVDEFLIEKRQGVELKLHSPTRREIVMLRDAPWEGVGGAAITVFKDGDKFRMYYDTFVKANEDGSNITYSEKEWFMCYAESKGGIRWTKPELGLVEFQKSKKNNIVMVGNLDATVIRDPNPIVPKGEEYRMVQGVMGKGLYAFTSPDGLRWAKNDKPFVLQKKGIPMFDTQNLIFWDGVRKQYWTYYRGYFSGKRDIFVATSPDFVNWSEGTWLDYGDSPKVPREQLYTIQVMPYPRAPHIFVGFPTRYVERGWHKSNLEDLPDPEHRKNRMSRDKGGIGEPRLGKALTEGLFMTSRDGKTFRKWGEAFIRPGPERKNNWVYGDGYQCWGLLETASADPHAPPEYSIYAVENYWRRPIQVRRYTQRLDGFVSLHAPVQQGEVVTKPFIFAGNRLTVNFATSAAGTIRIELLNDKGLRMPGYSLNDCDDLFGDAVERVVTWVSPDVGKLAGTTVRMRIVMNDADLYSFRFATK